MEYLLMVGKGLFRRLLLHPISPEDQESASTPAANLALSFFNVGEAQNPSRSCKIEYLSVESIKLSEWDALLTCPVLGCLGVVRIDTEDYLPVITNASLVVSFGSRRLYRIDKVEFVCISSSGPDGLVTSRLISSQLSPEFSDSAASPPLYQTDPCSEVRALLSSGTFYFAYDWDSTKSLQKLYKRSDAVYSWESCEKSFFWNQFLMKPVFRTIKAIEEPLRRKLQASGPFVACFRGFCQTFRMRLAQAEAQLTIISRVSCLRAGMRFLCRGIDDDGHVSNFVETEAVLQCQNYTFSNIVIRGTVPVFWDQQGFQLGFPRIQLTRSPIATQPAFDRHIDDLKQSYGLIHVVDLLNQKEGQAEHVLSHALDYHVRKYPEVGVLGQTVFDLYAVCKNHSYDRLESLFHLVGRDLQTFGYFVVDASGSVLREQIGVFRVNCLDCLDRTNTVQSYISKRTIDLFLRSHLLGSGTAYDGQVLHTQLAELWASNGDQLSRIYAGSNAIKSSYGRLGKLTLSSLVEDIKSTAKRFYLNNTDEKWRQRAIDLFLGKLTTSTDVRVLDTDDVGHMSAIEADMQRLDLSGPISAINQTDVVVQILTWNTNASVPIIGEDYAPLVSRPKGLPEPHLVAIGFQEIVQLNASQIMSVDPERRIQWEGIIMRCLNESSEQPYSLLVAHQLVGTTVSVFVRTDFMTSIRHVEIASKKTGMGGIVGNKGSVGVKMNVLGANFCFVSSHFTAGQAVAAERDRDMFSAVAELQMSGGRGILDNDVVFWFGDLNYRIDFDREHVRSLILEKNYCALLSGDQLRRRMQEGLVFQNFKEEDIAFAPTYKYDSGTNIYDSSEKMRIPSWTDRILQYSRSQIQVDSLLYNRVEIDCSDHKPVKGIFRLSFKSRDYDGASSSEVPLAEEGDPHVSELIDFSEVDDGPRRAFV